MSSRVRPGLVAAMLLVGCAATLPAPASPAREPEAQTEAQTEPEDCSGDADADRISDRCDACPRNAETYNGECDEDGCPDHGRVMERDEIRILEVVPFRSRSAVLAPSTADVLDALARTIAANPQIGVVTVVGEASAAERRSEQLASARAQAVIDALIASGTPAERLALDVAVGGTERQVRFELRAVPPVPPQPEGPNEGQCLPARCPTDAMQPC